MTEEGKVISKPTRKATLPVGFVLHETYIVKDILGSGGFGITYLAEHRRLNKLVAIKEYWPDDFATRDGTTIHPRHDREKDYAWGLQRFLDEAQTLARFRHQNIVGVSEFFEQHGTAYMVLDYEKGRSLRAWLDGLASPPTQEEVDLLVGPLLDALELLHNNKVLHRDIAPDNIYIRDNGTPVLLDFGSAREAISQRSKSVSAIVKAGYSPQEQYTLSGANQGPWTDIYALAATIYEMITGSHPLDAPERIMDDKYIPAATGSRQPYRPGFLSAIDWALRLMPKDRPQSIKEWREAFFATDANIPEPTTRNSATRVISQPGRTSVLETPAVISQADARKNSAALIIGALLFVPALGGIAWGVKTFVMERPGPTKEVEQPSSKIEPSKVEPHKVEPKKETPQPMPKPEAKLETPQPKPEKPRPEAAAPSASMHALSTSDRRGIARALYALKASDDAELDVDFVDRGDVGPPVRSSFERFQRLRQAPVTGELTQEQVQYLINMDSAPTPWEVEQDIPIIKGKTSTLWQRLRLTLLPDRSGGASKSDLREALKSYQQRKGLKPTGYLTRDVLNQLLDEPVGYPWAEATPTRTFGKWKLHEDSDRCKIWTETTHVGGRYLGPTAPVVEFTRSKKSKGLSMGFNLGQSQFFDISKPVNLIAADVGTFPLWFDRSVIKPAKGEGDAVTGDATAAMDAARSFKIVGTSIAGQSLTIEYSSDGFRSALSEMAQRCGSDLVAWLDRAGAVARFEGSFYGSWNYVNTDLAREAARTNCEKEHGAGKCTFTTFTGQQCWALARAVPDKGGWGHSVGQTIEEAREAAMGRCVESNKKCKISFTFCADGSNKFNDRD